MITTKSEKIIVDTENDSDPRLDDAYDTLMFEGNGYLTFNKVQVVVDGVQRFAIELNIATERETLLDAIKSAGLEVLEGAEKVE